MAGKRRRARWRWAGRILFGLLGLVVLTALVGAAYEWRASARDRARHVPPGEIVEVDGREVHLHCQGEGSPTVILDAGQGGWSTDWAEIMPDLGSTTRVCAYDRAGYGWSAASSGPRDPATLAAELDALLAAARLPAPFVLVGYSAAGLSARIYAARNPGEVVGLVLIDPASEFDNEILGRERLRQQRATLGMFGVFGAAARLGLVRILDPREIAPYAPFISRDPARPEIYYSFVSEPGWWRTSRREFSARLDEAPLQQVAENGDPGDMPLIVVAADPAAAPGDSDLLEARAKRLRALADGSERGRFIVAEGSSHEVLSDRPDVVISSVEEVVAEVRAQQ